MVRGTRRVNSREPISGLGWERREEAGGGDEGSRAPAWDGSASDRIDT